MADANAQLCAIKWMCVYIHDPGQPKKQILQYDIMSIKFSDS